MSKLIIEELPSYLNYKPNFTNLEFGENYTNRMLQITYTENKTWIDAKIIPFQNLSLSPATTVFHYSQEIFEGMKAYNRIDNKIGLFRPEKNFERLNLSAKRMSMPELDVDFAIESLSELLKLEKDWIPPMPGSSLYIRPTMIGTDPYIGVRPSKNYLYYVILSPVGAYYNVSDDGLNILVEDTFVRAVPGGTGEVKTGGNYSASLLGASYAQNKGYNQVLWLDAVNREYIEEVGTMNIFFVYGKGEEVVTPKLNGSILPGITRRSVIELLEHWGITVKETSLNIKDIVKDIENGTITESFGTGTAVVVTPVGSYGYKGKNYKINCNNSNNLIQRLYNTITDIHYGRQEDTFGWTQVI